MNNKKYKMYRLKVTNSKGNVKYKKKKGLDTTNYNEMMDFYREEKGKNEKAIMTFIGVTNDDVQEVLFEKLPKRCDKESKLDKTMSELVDELNELINIILLKQEYHNEMIHILEKKNNIMMHRIETFAKKDWKNEESEFAEKLAIFDMISDNREERRLHKNELYAIKEISNNINLKKLKNNCKITNWQEDVKIEYLDENKVKELKMIEEIPYSTDKERTLLMKKMNNVYNKVRTDYKRKVLVCYNTYKNCKK